MSGVWCSCGVFLLRSMVAWLQLNSVGRDDVELYSSVDVRVSYRTRVYSDADPDVTRAYAVDVYYRHVDRHYFVSVSTDVDDAAAGSFAVMINGLTMVDPVRRPFLSDDIVVKQQTNFAIVVATDDFRLQFDVDAKIYLRLDARFENKARICRRICRCSLDDGTTGRRDSTDTVGHRATDGRPVVLTTEWATMGQRTGQHGLTSRPFSCFLCGWDAKSLTVSGRCHNKLKC